MQLFREVVKTSYLNDRGDNDLDFKGSLEEFKAYLDSIYKHIENECINLNLVDPIINICKIQDYDYSYTEVTIIHKIRKTDKEIEKEKKAREKRKIANEKKRKAQEEKDLKLLAKLKNKYENNGN